MNYFRCTVGGSGKGNTVTVTCAEEFAGLTITLAKTGKTYTKTCPSTAPYVVTFYGVENGTYTVSCTVDGQTYSETVIVQDISCVLNYGFNWQTWVDTASQLDSSDYDSLDEVLADEKALRELFLEHACVDYMAESTTSNEDLETVINNDLCAKWINLSDYALDYLHANEVIADLMDEADKYFYGEWVITDSTTTPPTWAPKGNVPVMTSNTAPYGEVSASSIFNDVRAAYKAFDGDASSYWTTVANASAPWLRYKFVNPTRAKKARVEIRKENVTWTAKFKIQASNNGTTFVDVSDEISITPNTSGTVNETLNVDINTDNYYLYYQMKFSTVIITGGSTNLMFNLQFYGRELKVSVPTMTSNTAPYGVASATNLYQSNAYVGFSGATGARFNSGSSAWELQYKFVSPIIPKGVRYGLSSNNGTVAGTVKIQGSNNGTDWTDLTEAKSVSGPQGSFTYYNEDIETENLYLYLKATYTKNSGSGTPFMLLQFYGLDYSEKEFEAGTTKKWLYDHGVELETPIFRKGSINGSGVATNKGNVIELSAMGTDQKTTNYSVAMFGTIDLTNYSLIRERIGENFYNRSDYPNDNCLEIISNVNEYPDNGSYVDTYRLALQGLVVPTNMPDNLSIACSSINQSAYVTCTARWRNALLHTVKELWLE